MSGIRRSIRRRNRFEKLKVKSIKVKSKEGVERSTPSLLLTFNFYTFNLPTSTEHLRIDGPFQLPGGSGKTDSCCCGNIQYQLFLR
jgi:hypothetical protein